MARCLQVYDSKYVVQLHVLQEQAMPITHTEVRRHPRWKEQVNAQPGPLPTSFGARLIAWVAVFIVVTAVAVVLLRD